MPTIFSYMKKSVFYDIKRRIADAVAARRLNEAFSLTRSLSEGSMAWEITDALNTAEQSYRMLLSYAVSGAEDPRRDDMTAEIAETILTITDRLERIYLAKEESTLYYNNLRFLNAGNEQPLSSLLDQYRKAVAGDSLIGKISGNDGGSSRPTLPEKELLERRIFTLLWMTFPLSKSDMEDISRILSSGILPQHAAGLFTWGVILGGMEFYDPRRLEILCDLYASSDSRISAIALIGLLLVMHRWRDREFFRSLKNRFDSVKEMPGWKSDLQIAFMELTRTRDTDRISAKIREEIVPEMLKLRPEFERKISQDTHPVTPEEMEENPEWQEMLDKSGLADRLKEMSEIQEEGGDIMMATFAHLKQFPFFNELPNWFLPFHSNRSEFVDTHEKNELTNIAAMFEDLSFLCDSDKYSLLLSFTTIPKAQRQAVMSQLSAQADQFNEMRASSLDLSTDNRRNLIRRQIQNLFRFYRLFRRKGEFFNPFASGVNLTAVPAIVDDVKDAELLTLIAEFYFSHGYWQEALDVFDIVDSISVPSAGIFQKMGHSYMKLGKTSMALSCFEKADMLDNRSPWTLTRLVKCYSLLGNYTSALSAAERLEELSPDRPSNAMAIGRAHLALGNYTQAVNAFYKAFYLDEESGKALRPLAWSLLMDKQFDQSRKYYERIVSERDPLPEDYLNLGHLSLATAHYDEARNFYRLSVLSRPRPAGISGNEIPSASIESFINDMKADAKSLAHIGIPANLVPLMTDAIIYSLK